MPVLDYAAPPLRRQIGLFGATMLGLGSILGTGVFVGLPMATALAGPWVLLAIVLAGGLAFCNAMSSAQLAAAYPVSGGTYEYGYRLLSPAWGFTAGWTFLLAKSASAATAALAAAELVADKQLRDFIRPGILSLLRLTFDPTRRIQIDREAIASPTFLTLTVVLCLVASSLVGLRRTAFLNTSLVTLTLLGLLVPCTALYGSLYVQHGLPITDFFHFESQGRPFPATSIPTAVALCFVAFTGYGRLATIGEEVTAPSRTIPLAITLSLTIAVLVYLFVGLTTFALQRSVSRYEYGWKSLALPDLAILRNAFSPVFQGSIFSHPTLYLLIIAALTALLGVLLNLILGLSRVYLAMARRGDMPRMLARVSERNGTPILATIVSGLVIAAFVLVGDVRLTWSFSAFSVLIYYAITNWACLRLPAADRRYPRALAWVGLASCLGLAWFVEVRVWAVGVGLIALGLLWHRSRRAKRAQLQGI